MKDQVKSKKEDWKVVLLMSRSQSDCTLANTGIAYFMGCKEEKG